MQASKGGKYWISCSYDAVQELRYVGDNAPEEMLYPSWTQKETICSSFMLETIDPNTERHIIHSLQ